MTPERWKRIEEIFNSAAELPVPDRPAFVSANTDGDDELKIEVENLLASLDDAVGSSRVDLQACKLEYSIVSPK